MRAETALKASKRTFFLVCLCAFLVLMSLTASTVGLFYLTEGTAELDFLNFLGVYIRLNHQQFPV